MPFNGSGSFTRATGQPVVSGTVISSTTFNNYTADVANNGLSNCITKDGQTTVTQNIPFNSNRLTGVGDATALTDAMNVKGLQNGSFVNLGSVSGTDTITATVTPVPSAYASGQMFVFVPANDNTGAATINISSLGAKDIHFNGAALTGGELVAGVPVGIRYDGTQFEIMFIGSSTPFEFDGTLTSTDAGSSAGPSYIGYRDSASPAADDELGEVKYDGNDSGGNRTTYARTVGEIIDPTDTSEDGRLNYKRMVAGSEVNLGDVGQFALAPDATDGGTDAFTGNSGRTLASGQTYPWTFDSANTTTTPTLNDNSQGAKTIKRMDGSALGIGDIQNTTHFLYYDGTDYLLLNPAVLIYEGTNVDATNGGAGDLTEIDFTGIRSGAKMIVVGFSGVSLSGTDDIQIQIGDSGGVETSSYISVAGNRGGEASSTSGFRLTRANTASEAWSGNIFITRMDSSNKRWNSSAILVESGVPPRFSAGLKSLSAELDRVRITTTGTNTFDEGNINITVY